MLITGQPMFWGKVPSEAWPWMSNRWGKVDPSGFLAPKDSSGEKG
jgi:hypothetical protein